jgi:hypothetical protein
MRILVVRRGVGYRDVRGLGLLIDESKTRVTLLKSALNAPELLLVQKLE